MTWKVSDGHQRQPVSKKFSKGIGDNQRSHHYIIVGIATGSVEKILKENYFGEKRIDLDFTF